MVKQNKLLLLDGLYEGGRMFVGATSIAYMLSKGISIDKIGILKIIQAIVFILCELPTGVLADMYGKKISLIVSILCGILGFGIYFTGNTLIVFCFAEILVALSLCFWSGAYEAFCIDILKIDKDPVKLNVFFHTNSTVNKISTVLFGFLGGVIAFKNYAFPYAGALIVYIIVFIILLRFVEETKNRVTHSSMFDGFKYHFVEQVRITFKEGILHPLLLEFFVFQILLQASIQPLLHYWQPYFLILDKTITSSSLGTIFSLYVFCAAILSAIYMKMAKYSFYKNITFQAIPLIVFGTTFYFLGVSSNIYLSVLLFCLCQSFLGVVNSIFSAKFNEQISSEYRAGILSSMSLFSRVGAIISLGLISLSGLEASVKMDQVQNLFKLSSLLYSIVCLIFVMTILYLKSRKSTSNEV